MNRTNAIVATGVLLASVLLALLLMRSSSQPEEMVVAAVPVVLSQLAAHRIATEQASPIATTSPDNLDIFAGTPAASTTLPDETARLVIPPQLGTATPNSPEVSTASASSSLASPQTSGRPSPAASPSASISSASSVAAGTETRTSGGRPVIAPIDQTATQFATNLRSTVAAEAPTSAGSSTPDPAETPTGLSPRTASATHVGDSASTIVVGETVFAVSLDGRVVTIGNA